MLQQHTHKILASGAQTQQLRYSPAGPFGYGSGGISFENATDVQPAGAGDGGNLQPYRAINFIIKA